MTSQTKCELLKDGNCLSIMTNDEAREERLIGCSNSNIRACCSLCSCLQGCAISCKLEINRNGEENLPANAASENEKIRTLTCSLCNIVMLNSRMNLKVEASKCVPLAMDKIGEISKELLPVMIYMCPNCGKLEFMAQEKTKQRIINEDQ